MSILNVIPYNVIKINGGHIRYTPMLNIMTSIELFTIILLTFKFKLLNIL